MSNDLTPEKLAELRQLLAEFRETKPGRATAAPFAALVDALLTHADALLDAAAERDALAAAVERVRALHWIDDDDDSGKWCGYCQSDFDAAQADDWWPCPTICALDESEADK